MNHSRRPANVSDKFPPLLVELVQQNAPDAQLRDEGFTSWEIHAVRTLVKRAGSSSTTTGAAH